MKRSFPAYIDAVDCAWLSRVLTQSGQLAAVKVSRFRAQPIDAGYTSTLYRLCLEYENPPPAAPQCLVIKFHSRSQNIRDSFDQLGIYEKEVRFYQFIDAELGLPVPVCYAAEYDKGSGDFVLLLQDLAPARPACWDPDPLADIRTALPQLARIHAQFWDDPQLEKYPWIVQPTRAPASNAIKLDWRDNLHRVKQTYRHLWPRQTWLLCDQILEHWASIMRCMNRDPHTLVHTDSHLGQMFFPTAELPHFYLIDWQYPSRSLAAEDVVHLIVNDLSPVERRAQESSLFNLYYDSLCQQEVTGLSHDRFLFQCRLSLVWLILMNFRTLAEPDLLARMQSEAEEWNEDWRDWIFGQLGAAIDDWNLRDTLMRAIAEGQP